MSSIKLSKKHGVNPSLMQCFYCMQDKGIALMGKLRDDAEAPRRVCVDREPCDECRDHMEKGIMLVSVQSGSSGDNPPRTGAMCVVTEDFIQRVVQPPELANNIVKKRFTYVPDDAWDKIGLPRGNDEE